MALILQVVVHIGEMTTKDEPKGLHLVVAIPPGAPDCIPLLCDKIPVKILLEQDLVKFGEATKWWQQFLKGLKSEQFVNTNWYLDEFVTAQKSVLKSITIGNASKSKNKRCKTNHCGKANGKKKKDKVAIL